MGGKITAQFVSTSLKFQNSLMIYLLIITVTSKWKLKNTSESISVSAQSRSYASAASPSNTALSIVDDLADWEKRKKNVNIYNFLEASDCEADRGFFWTCENKFIILILVSIKWYV